MITREDQAAVHSWSSLLDGDAASKLIICIVCSSSDSAVEFFVVQDLCAGKVRVNVCQSVRRIWYPVEQVTLMAHMGALGTCVYSRWRMARTYDGSDTKSKEARQQLLQDAFSLVEQQLGIYESAEVNPLRMISAWRYSSHKRVTLLEGSYVGCKALAAVLQFDLNADSPKGIPPIRTALVTARNSPAHERVIRTLRAWNVRIDETFFMGGVPKSKILESFSPHIQPAPDRRVRWKERYRWETMLLPYRWRWKPAPRPPHIPYIPGI